MTAGTHEATPYLGQPDVPSPQGGYSDAFTPNEVPVTAYRVVMVVDGAGVGTLMAVRDASDLEFPSTVIDFGSAEGGAIAPEDRFDDATPEHVEAGVQSYGKPPVSNFSALSKPNGYIEPTLYGDGVPTPVANHNEAQPVRNESRHFGLGFDAISRGWRKVRSARHTAHEAATIEPDRPLVERNAFTSVEAAQPKPHSQAPRLLFPDLVAEPAPVQAAENVAAPLRSARSASSAVAAARRGRERAQGAPVVENPLATYRGMNQVPRIGRHRVSAARLSVRETEIALRPFRGPETPISTSNPTEANTPTRAKRAAKWAGRVLQQIVWPT